MPELIIVEPSFEIITPLEHIKDYMRLIETAGRTCYKSEERMTENSADTFVRKIVINGHESVLEHCSITARLIGDRSMSHQLVRHRIAAYSQESQRYCNYGKKGFQAIIPPSIRDREPTALVEDWKAAWIKYITQINEMYLCLLDVGIPPEDARTVLPNATKTEVVTTYNLRQWRHVFKHRAVNKRAQWQIKMIMQDGLRQFKKLLPVIFEDIELPDKD